MKDGEWIRINFVNYAIDVFIERRDLPDIKNADWKSKQMMAKELLGIETYPRDYIRFIPKDDPGDIEAGRFGSSPASPSVDLIEKADKTAQKAHQDQKYNGDAYIKHPRRVKKILIEEFKDCFRAKDLVILACGGLLHDTPEDSAMTYRDINRDFGFLIAAVVYAVTNERGSTPYHRIQKSRLATAVKLADRMDNLRNALPVTNDSKRFANKYYRANERFYYELCETSRYGLNSKLKPMWDEYLSLIKQVEEGLKEV